MPMIAEAETQPTAQQPHSHTNLADAIQAELTALGEIETRYENMRQSLYGWTGSEAERQGLLAQIEECYRRDRESHILRLADLHQRRTLLKLFRSQRTAH